MTSKDDSSRYGRIGDVARKRVFGHNTNENKNNMSESIASSNNNRTMVTSSSSSSTEPKKRAAVLVLLFEKKNTRREEEGILHVVLTKRSADMNSHAGQVAFPGGKLDDEDLGNDIECALREAKEEIGLNRNHEKVLTVLHEINQELIMDSTNVI